MAHTDLLTYIAQARKKHIHDTTIKNNLIAVGWDPLRAEAGLKAEPGDLPIPAPPRATAAQAGFDSDKNEPIAVVHNLSSRGFEYFIMLISLGVAAISLGILAHWLVDILSTPKPYDTAPVSAVAAAIVTLPIFAFMTIRLKRAERALPALLHDASRKRALQLAVVIAFIVGVSNLIIYFASLLSGPDAPNVYDSTKGMYSQAASLNPQLISFLHMAITLLIAGSIFAYYWTQLQLGKHRAK